MPTVKALNALLADSQALKGIAETLGEIATMQVRVTRHQIVHASMYFREMTDVYHALKLVAARRDLLMLQKQRNGSGQVEQKNGKIMSVVLTSNIKLYGSIDEDTLNFYLQKTQNLKTDRIVLGAVGAHMLHEKGFSQPYAKMQFKEDSPTLKELQYLANILKPYSKVYVFYSKFESLIAQKPAVIDLSQSAIPEEVETSKIGYILEPEVDKMLAFFESQLLILLVQSVFLQQQLSRLASRMISMNQAELNADHLLSTEKTALLHAKKVAENAEILGNFFGRRGQQISRKNGVQS